MKHPTTSTLFLILITVLTTCRYAKADSATWTAAASGNWTDFANWSPNTTYPNGINQAAVFSQNALGADRTVTVNEDVTVGSLDLQSTANFGFTLSGTNTITLANSGTASITIRKPSGSGTPKATISAGMILDTATVNISATTGGATFSGNINKSGTLESPIVINAFSNATGAGTTNQSFRIALSGSNNFGIGSELRVNGVGGIYLQSSSAAGGANTTIRFNDNTSRALLNLSVTGNVNYGNDIAVSGTGGGRIVLQNGAANGQTRSYVGSIGIEENKTLFVQGFTTQTVAQSSQEWTRLYVKSNETVYIASGGLLLAQGFRSGATSNIYLESGAKLTGNGTVATAAFGGDADSYNHPITLNPGAILDPGSPEVANSSGQLSIGNATFATSKLNLSVGAIAHFDLNGITAGVDYDQVLVNGASNLTIDGAALEFTLSYGYDEGTLLFLVVASDTATISGTFAGLEQGAIVTLGTVYTAQISYTGSIENNSITGGNDIVLYNLVPEPSSALLLGAGLGWLFVLRRGKGKRSARFSPEIPLDF